MYALILALVLALAPHAAHAITILPPCTASGDCGISDLLGVGINFAEFLLGISGAVALGFFVWGGFQMVLAAGSQEKVKKGFETIRNASIGILIIFLSGVLVRFTSSALTGNNNICTQGQANAKQCVAVVGDTCAQGGGAIWVLIPGGYTNASDPAGSIEAESLQCIPKDNCGSLKSALQQRNRPEASSYGCFATDDPNVTSCVRGLCPSAPAGYACCICPNGGCAGK